jgi:transposase
VSQDIGIGWPVQRQLVSKARLVITAVIIEGRSQSEVAREYGVSQGWISRLVKRYRLEGEAAFEPQSRRPHTSPTRLAQATIDLIIQLRAELASKGLDNEPATISWHLRHHHGVTVGAATIHRHLRAAGLVSPQPPPRRAGAARSTIQTWKPRCR